MKIEIVTKFINEVWNEGSMDAVPEFIAETYTIHHDPGDPWEGKMLSHDEFKRRLKYSFDSFPDINFEISGAIEEGDHVAICWILTGTNLGRIGDIPPTNKRIRTNGITIYHFKGDLINGHTQVLNRSVVAQQLGFLDAE